ncbi:hypothetical protein ACQPXS_35940 [Streptomyces sp. CA-142005]|uniref:hypothetical protein n=1 Tax=Streptomyces sp. CA-142005 TaxID=3240052 RepID=UPI003D92804C
MARGRLRDRFRYWFDGTMDRGTPALISWLALASVVLIVLVTTLVVALTNTDAEQNGGWLGVAWMSLLRTLDPGTMGGDTGGPLFLALMLTVTIGGIFIVSALIGVLTTGLDHRIQKLRKGRSRLMERGHTIVLGWSDQIFTVIAELVEANQSERRSCVVILADRDKVDMEDAIRARIPRPAAPASSAAPATLSYERTWNWSARTQPSRSWCCPRSVTTVTSTSSRPSCS